MSPRTEVDITREAAEAAQAISSTLQAWKTFLPKREAVDSARHALAGLQRLLVELSSVQIGGSVRGQPGASERRLGAFDSRGVAQHRGGQNTEEVDHGV